VSLEKVGMKVKVEGKLNFRVTQYTGKGYYNLISVKRHV